MHQVQQENHQEQAEEMHQLDQEELRHLHLELKNN